jgi:AraC-like DNA-binding protein
LGCGVEQIASFRQREAFDPASYFFAVALYFVPWCYALACLRAISRMNTVLKGFYSSTHESGTTSFQWLVYGYVIVWSWQLFTQMLTNYLRQLPNGDLPNTFGLVANYLEFSLLFALYAYSTSSDYNRLAQAVNNDAVTNVGAQSQHHEPLASSAATDQLAAVAVPDTPYDFARSSWTCADKINEAMESRKIFLDHSINLERFSARIGERPKDVSYALNAVFKTTFFEFINSHRVGEAKRLLLLDDVLCINDVIEQSGFSSKSAFHRVFKMATAMTPGQFRLENKPRNPQQTTTGDALNLRVDVD